MGEQDQERAHKITLHTTTSHAVRGRGLPRTMPFGAPILTRCRPRPLASSRSLRAPRWPADDRRVTARRGLPVPEAVRLLPQRIGLMSETN